MVRDKTFDLAKFIVMLFVVYGHMPWFLTEKTDGMSYFSNFNIGVAMPLFFIVSGYFAHNTIYSGGRKIIARIVSLLWPLASFGFCFASMLFLFGEISLLKLLGWPFIRILYGGWFLTTLAIVYMAHYIAIKMGKTLPLQVAILCFLYAIFLFLPRQGYIFYWTGNTVNMFPYFTFGFLVLKRFTVFRDWRISIPCLVIFLMVVFFEGDIHTNGMGFYWTKSDWRSILLDSHAFACFIGRFLVGVIGTISLLWSVDVLTTMFQFLNNLSVFGTTTLGVYVLHEYPLRMIHKYGWFDSSSLSSFWRFPLTLVVFFICHGLIMLIRKNVTLKYLFFGNEKWFTAQRKKSNGISRNT